MLRIVTWNINSVRLRLPLLASISKVLNPDVFCLQETKVRDELFPEEEIRMMGYEHQYFWGEKSYNGVAILSKVPFKKREHRFWAEEAQTRHLSVELPNGIELHNFYVPAGGDIPDPEINKSYAYKLNFIEDMIAWFSHHRTAKEPMILLGDLNIAPLEHDVWSHRQLRNVVSHTEPEIARFNQFMETCSWVDVPREFVSSDEKLYSWWSYRNRDWKKSNRGRRLDHILMTPELQRFLSQSQMMVEARDFDKPSDHVPVIVDLSI